MTAPIPRRLAAFALPFLFVVAVGLSGRADVVILKDGFTLYGKTTKESEPLQDPNGQTLSIAKVNGFNSIDDGCRVTVFPASIRQVADSDVKDLRADLVVLRTQIYYTPGRKPLRQAAQFFEVGKYDKNWRRTLKARTDKGTSIVTQQITVMTPFSVRIDSPSHVFTSNYLTQEMGPDALLPLLDKHPDIAEPDGKPNADKRMRLFRFKLQAGWYDLAGKELDRLEKDMPAEKERVASGRKLLTQSVAEKAFEEVEAARAGGRHAAARETLGKIPVDQIEGQLLVRVSTLKAQYDAAGTAFASARRHLTELPTFVSEPGEQFLVGAARAILDEAHEDTAERLETFVALADQAERDKKAGRAVTHLPGELLSAAVTGWLQGKTSTEPKVAAARRLWRGREFLLGYLREPERRERQKALDAFRVRSDALAFDEAQTMVPLLPPTEREALPAGTPVTRRTPKIAGFPDGVEYTVVAPPEYAPGRPYPVLVALCHGNERPEAMVERLGYHAAKFGYVLVCPRWTLGFEDRYEFTASEQLSVLEVIRHVRTIAQVDSDRLFLLGAGQGANFAFDLGVARPDLFAGVVPVHPAIRWNEIMVEYWRNAQLLPYYVIMGTYVAEQQAKLMRKVFEQWMPRGYPAIQVYYKGRGTEWFAAEVPIVFDWMNRKRRATGFPEFNRAEEEFRTLREGDARFYWLSTDSINDRNLLENLRPNGIPNPARLGGRAVVGENLLQVTAFGVKRVTVWLSRGMFDLERPLTIRVNNRLIWNNGGKPVKPDLGVLLEDLVERGDRQRPFLAKVDFANP